MAVRARPFGESVALSADGREALVGAQFADSGAGAAYLFAKVAGTWGTTPVAIFEGSSDENLGFSVALSADGRVALVAPRSRTDEVVISRLEPPGPAPATIMGVPASWAFGVATLYAQLVLVAI